MTIAARINLQKGIPEDKTKEWTNYTVESLLDAYIVARVESMKRATEQRRKLQQEESLKEYIKEEVKEKLDYTIKSSFDYVFKDLQGITH